MAPTLTLNRFAKEMLRPAILHMVGLPDTPEGNAELDRLVSEALEADRASD